MGKKKTPTQKNSILFEPGHRRCEFEGSPTILEVALANKIDLNHSCGGMGSCTTCLVFVRKGLEKFSMPEDVEAEHVRMRGWEPHERLSCQNLAQDGLVLEIPKAKK